jgi:hypothetical protein
MKPKRKGKSIWRKSGEVINRAADEARREGELEDEIELDAEEEAEERSEKDQRAAAKTRFEKSLSLNPIVAAVQRALHSRGVRVRLMHSVFPKGSLDMAFGNATELQTELGGMILNALTLGDREFAKVVADAVRKIDPVFLRHRNKVFLEKAHAFVESLKGPHPPVDEIRKDLEGVCGRKFNAHEWSRLREQLFLPKQAPRAGPGRGNRTRSKTSVLQPRS